MSRETKFPLLSLPDHVLEQSLRFLSFHEIGELKQQKYFSRLTMLLQLC